MASIRSWLSRGHHLVGRHGRLATRHGRRRRRPCPRRRAPRSRWWRRRGRRRRGPGCRRPAPASSSSRQASMRRFSSKGSPTCTLGRLAASSASPRRRRSRPTRARSRRRSRRDRWSSRAARPGCPRPTARPSTRRSIGSTPMHNTLTSGLLRVARVEGELAADGRAPRPSCRSRRCPPPPPRSATAGGRRRAGRRTAGPSRAIGRAPMVKMSRRMPPTPVAAPW